MKKSTKRFWTSVITNVSFPALVMPFLEWSAAGVYVAVAMIGLMICSGGFHWYEHEKEYLGDQWRDSTGWIWQKADEIAMFFVFWSMFCYILGGGIPLLLVSIAAPVVMAFYHHEFHNSAIGVLGLMVVAVKITQNPWLALSSFITFIVALVVGRYAQRTRNEKWHGVWHAVSAAAFMQLVL